MALIKLGSKEREQLRQIARASPQGRPVRRAQALLWLDQGLSIAEVAQRLSMSRQAIYNLIARYQSRRRQPAAKRVSDSDRVGRPAHK